MATSGETAWARTAGDLIKSAMVELGAISAGDEPENGEYDEAVVRLNGYLQELDVEGLMFRETSDTVTVLAGTGVVAIPHAMGKVSSARLVMANSQRPLASWNRSEYFALPNRAQTGQYPSIYYLSPAIDGAELRVWPVPATDITLHLDFQRPVEIVTGPDETIDIPQQWHNCVMMNLASRMASMFGTDRLDQVKVARVDGRAAQLHQRLLDADRPDSYIFEPYYA